MTRASKLLAVLIGLNLVAGLTANSLLSGAERVREQRAARILRLPPAETLLASARRADVCFEQLGAGVYGLHRRGETFRDVRVTRGAGSAGVSVTAGGITEDQMDAAVAEYRRSGQSPRLYEQLTEAVDLGLISRDALRC